MRGARFVERIGSGACREDKAESYERRLAGKLDYPGFGKGGYGG